MAKVKFITLLGTKIEINDWTLDSKQVETKAKHFFGDWVDCRAGVFGNACTCVGWQFRSKKDDRIVGYMSLASGEFSKIEDFEYGIAVFVPLCEDWAELSQLKLCLKDGRIEMLF